ncbi:hypothetical protein [Roseococcus pinisoli]|uniref:Uncharacterized protein n=1 Tax=Roseococcus pinisoli TaxID=2835040 RepID=A0ABS5QC13_9PROT|nr:hypothetical protein [Roseococcus pinisoli]MBS7811219.1 hypothetical protein [Roseococcus pinisoli]
MSEDDARLRAVELKQAVHEAQCLERQRQINYKLNLIIAGMAMLLGAGMTGNSALDLIRRWLGVL